MIEDIRQIIAYVFDDIILYAMSILGLYSIGIATIDLFRMFRG